MGAGSDTSDIPHTDQNSMTSEELTQGITDEVASALKCDGTPCQASCTAPIPSAASDRRLGRGLLLRRIISIPASPCSFLSSCNAPL